MRQSAAIVGVSSVMNFGNSSKLRSRSARRSAVACAAMLRLHDRVRDRLALLRPTPPAPCRRPSSPSASSLFWLREDREHLVELAQRRVGPADHRAQVLAAAREARPELVQDDREALTVRAAHHAADQVLADRRDRVRRGQQVLARAGLAVRDLPQRRRRRIALGARLRRDALDQLLADHRLEPDLALGVAAEVLEAGVRRSSAPPRPACRRSPRGRRRCPPSRRRSSRPRRGSRTRRCRRSRGPCSRRRCHRPRPAPTTTAISTPSDAQRDDQPLPQVDSSRASRARTGRWLGSQSSAVSLPSSVNGLELSGAGWVAAPGQNRLPPRSCALARSAGAERVELVGALVVREAVEDRQHARVVPVRVVVGGDLARSASARPRCRARTAAGTRSRLARP